MRWKSPCNRREGSAPTISSAAETAWPRLGRSDLDGRGRLVRPPRPLMHRRAGRPAELEHPAGGRVEPVANGARLRLRAGQAVFEHPERVARLAQGQQARDPTELGLPADPLTRRDAFAQTSLRLDVDVQQPVHSNAVHVVRLRPEKRDERLDREPSSSAERIAPGARESTCSGDCGLARMPTPARNPNRVCRVSRRRLPSRVPTARPAFSTIALRIATASTGSRWRRASLPIP